jgi:acetyltransferase-like isoleucine patch superfamily enzyme
MRSFWQRLGHICRNARERYAVEGLASSRTFLVFSARHYVKECASRAIHVWERTWMKRAGVHAMGRGCARLASLFAPPMRPPVHLAQYHPQGYVSARAVIRHRTVHRGRHVYIGDGVALLQDAGGQSIDLADGVQLYGRSELTTGRGGTIRIGADTHIQEGCRLIAQLGSIHIGNWVDIAPNCAFYPYNHGTALDLPPMLQPLTSKGDIIVEDGVWLGYGVVVLSGVRIGCGAVIGAGAVVCTDIPQYAIAVGAPARVVRSRHATRHAVGHG